MKVRTLPVIRSRDSIVQIVRKIPVSIFMVLALVGTPFLAWAGTCTVDATVTNQYIHCIGASSAWYGLNGGSAQALFADDSVNGHIGLSSIRMRIDPNDTGDGSAWNNELNSFTSAVSANPNVICWGTEWSPPAAYKSNNSVNGYVVSGGVTNIGSFTGAGSGTPNSADTNYAQYLTRYIKYVKSYAKVDLYSISPQNEPSFHVDYEGADWTAGQFDVFVKCLAASITSAGLSTKIMIPEPANEWSMNLADTTMNDSAAASLVGIVCTHMYGRNPETLASHNWSHLTNQEFWETEISGNTTDMAGALDEAGWVHNCLVNASMNAFHYWWFEDLVSNNNLNIKAYVLGNYSKFIRPGYYRMGATAVPSSGVSVSAYKNTNNSSPTTIVIVAINGSGSAVNQTFNLSGLTTTSVVPWLTNSSTNLVKQTAAAVSGNSFTYSLPASSVISFVAVNNAGPTATPTRTLSPTYTPTPVVSSSWRVNAGGPAYTDSLGNLWAADENYSGGSTVASGGAVTGTSDSTLYDTQRYGSSFSYSFNVPAGSYQVTLKFAETYSGDYSTGARIFNVAINGVTLSTNMDIYAQVGSDTVDDKIYNNVSPSGGVITIQFTGTSSTDTSAVVEALQIIPMPATATFTPTRTSTATTTRTLSPTLTSTATFTRTATSTMTSTSTPTFTPTSTATRTATPSATPTDTATRTATYTFTPTATASSTSSPTATSTRTNTPTSTQTNTAVPPTSTSISTATTTSTVTRTNTPTSTPTSSSTAIFTSSWTATSTSTYTGVPSATETHSNTPTSTLTQTNTAVPSTSIPTSSSTPTWTSTPTSTSSNTASSTVTATNTVVPSTTSTQTFTSTAVPPTTTVTETASSTNTVVPSPTATQTSTVTVVPPTETDTWTFTATVTSTSTLTVTSTSTDSPVPSATPTLTLTATFSATESHTPTQTLTPSGTTTATATFTATRTWTSTYTLTSTPTFSSTPTATASFTSTLSGTPTVTTTFTPVDTPTSEGGCNFFRSSNSYPNPVQMGGTAWIDLQSGCPKKVAWTVYTVAYRRIAEGELTLSGRGRVAWNLTEAKGKPVASGLFYWVLKPEGQKSIVKTVVVLP